MQGEMEHGGVYGEQDDDNLLVYRVILLDMAIYAK